MKGIRWKHESGLEGAKRPIAGGEIREFASRVERGHVPTFFDKIRILDHGNLEAFPPLEILYPVALVILGGLFSSTLLDFAVTPAIFFNYSGKTIADVAESAMKTPNNPNNQIRKGVRV